MSESIHVKSPHCWKSPVAAQLWYWHCQGLGSAQRGEVFEFIIDLACSSYLPDPHTQKNDLCMIRFESILNLVIYTQLRKKPISHFLGQLWQDN